MDGLLIRAFRASYGIFVAALWAVGLLLPVSAQDIGSKLSADRLGEIEPGYYEAGDRIDFVLVPLDDRYLLKFDGQDEVFVLQTARGSVGGRVLKYDTGDMAVQVAGWGGITLYTEEAPNGLPAVRLGDAPALEFEPVSLAQLQRAANDVAHGLNLQLEADWSAFAADPRARAVALEALMNTRKGVGAFASSHGKAPFERQVTSIKLVPNTKPALSLTGKTLAVGFAPTEGYPGRLSSHAVVETLNGLMPN